MIEPSSVVTGAVLVENATMFIITLLFSCLVVSIGFWIRHYVKQTGIIITANVEALNNNNIALAANKEKVENIEDDIVDMKKDIKGNKKDIKDNKEKIDEEIKVMKEKNNEKFETIGQGLTTVKAKLNIA